MSYRTPYDVFESIHGNYDPDKPHDMPFSVPFSVWMSAEKTAYLIERPQAKTMQIDGHFFEIELERFFRWISERKR